MSFFENFKVSLFDFARTLPTGKKPNAIQLCEFGKIGRTFFETLQLTQSSPDQAERAFLIAGEVADNLNYMNVLIQKPRWQRNELNTILNSIDSKVSALQSILYPKLEELSSSFLLGLQARLQLLSTLPLSEVSNVKERLQAIATSIEEQLSCNYTERIKDTLTAFQKDLEALIASGCDSQQIKKLQVSFHSLREKSRVENEVVKEDSWKQKVEIVQHPDVKELLKLLFKDEIKQAQEKFPVASIHLTRFISRVLSGAYCPELVEEIIQESHFLNKNNLLILQLIDLIRTKCDIETSELFQPLGQVVQEEKWETLSDSDILEFLQRKGKFSEFQGLITLAAKAYNHISDYGFTLLLTLIRMQLMPTDDDLVRVAEDMTAKEPHISQQILTLLPKGALRERLQAFLGTLKAIGYEDDFEQCRKLLGAASSVTQESLTSLLLAVSKSNYKKALFLAGCNQVALRALAEQFVKQRDGKTHYAAIEELLSGASHSQALLALASQLYLHGAWPLADACLKGIKGQIEKSFSVLEVIQYLTTINPQQAKDVLIHFLQKNFIYCHWQADCALQLLPTELKTEVRVACTPNLRSFMSQALAANTYATTGNIEIERLIQSVEKESRASFVDGLLIQLAIYMNNANSESIFTLALQLEQLGFEQAFEKVCLALELNDDATKGILKPQLPPCEQFQKVLDKAMQHELSVTLTSLLLPHIAAKSEKNRQMGILFMESRSLPLDFALKFAARAAMTTKSYSLMTEDFWLIKMNITVKPANPLTLLILAFVCVLHNNQALANTIVLLVESPEVRRAFRAHTSQSKWSENEEFFSPVASSILPYMTFGIDSLSDISSDDSSLENVG